MAPGDWVSSLVQASRIRAFTEELSQQQQRTRDLAHRLQQLEDESAQHQNSEAGWIKSSHRDTNGECVGLFWTQMVAMKVPNPQNCRYVFYRLFSSYEFQSTSTKLMFIPIYFPDAWQEP